MPSIARLMGDPELKSLDTCTYDADGFLVCSVHHQRRYGWRSLPVDESPAGRRSVYACAKMTELETERFVLFGEEPGRRGFEEIVWQQSFDLRDNRDPEEIGKSLLAMGPRQQEQNGHVVLQTPGGGRKLMAYHQQLATAQNMSKDSAELVKREIGF